MTVMNLHIDVKKEVSRLLSRAITLELSPAPPEVTLCKPPTLLQKKKERFIQSIEGMY